MESIWAPMSMLNVWRIPLLFFVSGMGVCFAIKRRNWLALIKERTQRILVPFLFGMVAIVPLHIFLWQHYYNQLLRFTVIPFHLWFLGNIFIYVVALSPLFFWLKRIDGSQLSNRIKTVFSSPLGLLSVMGFFVAEVILINPESFETYAMNWHGFTLGLIAFCAGFLFIYSGQPFWEMLRKYTWFFLAGAIAFYLVRYFHWDLVGPYYLTAIESCLWIFTVFSMGYRYLNSNSRYLAYLSQAAYPVYILHMLFLNLSCTLIFALDIPVAMQFVLVVLFTLMCCFLTYELIRRVNILRPLFGLKVKSRQALLDETTTIERAL